MCVCKVVSRFRVAVYKSGILNRFSVQICLVAEGGVCVWSVVTWWWRGHEL